MHRLARRLIRARARRGWSPRSKRRCARTSARRAGSCWSRTPHRRAADCQRARTCASCRAEARTEDLRDVLRVRPAALRADPRQPARLPVRRATAASRLRRAGPAGRARGRSACSRSRARPRTLPSDDEHGLPGPHRRNRHRGGHRTRRMDAALSGRRRPLPARTCAASAGSRRTPDAYAATSPRFVAFCDAAGSRTGTQLDSQHVRSFAAQWHRHGLSPRSIQRRLSAVRSFFRYLIREGELAHNPAADIRAPKARKRLPKTLDADQMARLLESARDDRLACATRRSWSCSIRPGCAWRNCSASTC